MENAHRKNNHEDSGSRERTSISCGRREIFRQFSWRVIEYMKDVPSGMKRIRKELREA